ncbi:MAG: condensation domain-containing protein, partial [Acidobacteriota bacterium]|nr:condensation domain-containing protein [Acidobacteriota bacterium]
MTRVVEEESVQGRSVFELLEALQALDVRVWVEGEKLRLNAPKGALTAELKDELRQRKDELLELLSGSGGEAEPLEPQLRPEALPLSFAQERMWFVHQVQPDQAAFHLPSALRLRGKLEVAVLEEVLFRLVQRHESLRTRFEDSPEGPVQHIEAPAIVRESFQLPVVDLEGLVPEGPSPEDPPPEAVEAHLRQLAGEAASRPFDLARGPLLRSLLVRLGHRD